MWAALVLVRVEDVPDEVPDGWARVSWAATGWAGWSARTADPTAPWMSPAGPMLTATVLDSDVAMLIGWAGGVERFRWVFNDELADGYGMPVPDVTRGDAVAAMLDWAGHGDAARLDDILERGYVCADDGLFAALTELGVHDPDAADDEPVEVSLPEPDPHPQELLRELLHPAPHPLDLVDGDAFALPERDGPVFLAATIDTEGPAWQWMVVDNELEHWGRPGCLIAQGIPEVAAGGLTSHGTWLFHLATDPAVTLTMWRGALGTASTLPDHGPWHLVPTECPDPVSAAAWAREHVAAPVEPPSPHRERLSVERAEQLLGLDRLMLGDGATSRVGDQALIGELFTYVDLADRADDLADWLTEARRLLLDPAIRAYEGYVNYGDAGDPYAVLVRIHATSVKGRHAWTPGDPAGWAAVLDRLRAGQVRDLTIELIPYGGAGRPSRFRGGVSITVELRDQFTADTGPLADDHPARINFRVAQPLLTDLDAVRTLMRRAALEFGAEIGYVHGSGSLIFNQTPYERRTPSHWWGQRMDTTGRGVHWGNLVGAGHVDPARLDGLDLTRIEQWSPDRWWFEIAADPFGSVNARADEIAAQLPELLPPADESRTA